MNHETPAHQTTDQIDQALPARTALTDYAHLGLDDQQSLDPLAQRILKNPIAMERLSDRVYQLLMQDIHLLNERRRSPGRY